MNAAAAYRLAQGVAIRPERFGALVYRYDNRSLYFLHSKEVAAFIDSLDGSCPLDEAAEAFVARRALPASTTGVLLRTMSKLADMGLVEAVAERRANDRTGIVQPS